MRYQTMSMATSAESAHYWSMASAQVGAKMTLAFLLSDGLQDDLGLVTGVALFFVLFKVMKVIMQCYHIVLVHPLWFAVHSQDPYHVYNPQYIC